MLISSLLQHPGKTFDEVFEEVAARQYSQFNVMCTYLWYHHRDEYKWYVHETNPELDWSSDPVNNFTLPISTFPMSMRQPKPRVATHARYRANDTVFFPKGQQSTVEDFIRVGNCYSPPFPKSDELCRRQYDPLTTYWPEMHQFDLTDWNPSYPREQLLRAHVARHYRIRHCNFTSDHRFDGPMKKTKRVKGNI